ncbi:MAG TPA: glycosyltransferase family 39 protein [Candidatus Manganitrophaceae bacterium]|nr:glycosyltransferase family 39 protein [Candidatus Manganitrophaceae bacterium]
MRASKKKKFKKQAPALLPSSDRSGYWTRYSTWGVMLLILLSVAVIRIRLLEAPFERDEGEYAYAGQLILQGVAPYLEAYNMKLPGTYAAYAVIMALFGQTHGSVHFGLLLVNAATIIMMFLLAKRLFDARVGLAASASFALLSLSQSVQGVFANAEHFVILPALGGTLLLLKAIDSDGVPFHRKPFPLGHRLRFYFAGGALLGSAFIMKQHGIFFVGFGALYLLWDELKRRPIRPSRSLLKGLVFLVGAALPFASTCLALFMAGAFENFRFWTFQYAREYVSQIPLSAGFSIFKDQLSHVAGPAILLWGIAVIGGTALFWDKEARSRAVFVGGFFIFSFLAVCPGLFFREHYFILLLPAVSLLTGVAVGSIRNRMSIWKGAPALVFTAALIYSFIQQKAFFFEMTPREASRTTYGANPFPESLEIADYIKKKSAEGDRIAVLGSEPQIYFYSGRRSATGHIYTYGLMENQKYARRMQEEMIQEIEAARPLFLVFAAIPTSWLRRPESENLIFDWFGKYIQEGFDRVGVIDILSADRTEYAWDAASAGYAPKSEYYLLVFKRKG